MHLGYYITTTFFSFSQISLISILLIDCILVQETQFHGTPNYRCTLRKIPSFHLISWCGNFVHTRKLAEITVFYAVVLSTKYGTTVYKKCKTKYDSFINRYITKIYNHLILPIPFRYQ